MPAGLVSGESCVPGLQRATFSLRPYIAFPLFKKSLKLCYFNKTSSIGLCSYINDLKSVLSRWSHMGGLELTSKNLQGDTVQSVTLSTLFAFAEACGKCH